MSRSSALILIAAAFACVCMTLVRAEDKPLRPGRLPSEERKALVQGLRLSFAQGDGTDTRSARLAALHVPAGEAPTPFLEPGQFSATLSGYLKIKLKGEYTLYAEGNGTVTVKLNDEPELSITADGWKSAKPVNVELIKGYNKIHIDYASPKEGAATLRLFWSSEEEAFPKEPLPAELLTHDSRNEQLVEGLALRQGRELFVNRRCVACHTPKSIEAIKKTGMPEVAADAPSLKGVGSRLSPDWIASWLKNPQAMRTHTTMPKLLKGDGKAIEQQAADLSAFLTSLTAAAKPVPADGSGELVQKGEALFETLGCISCHTFNDPAAKPEEDSDEEEDEYNRITLHYVNSKFVPGALADFLREPRKHYPWSRMPDFELTKDEASALAAFVRSSSKGTVAKVPAGDVGRGKELFAKLGCNQCHTTSDELKAVSGFAQDVLGSTGKVGCLAEEKHAKAPEFDLTEAEYAAIQKFLAAHANSLERRVDAEFSHRQFNQMRCTSCHQRDTTDADLAYILDEEGALGETPPIIPALTWTGEKLHPKWSAAFISGEHDVKPRPWLKIRMPNFAARGEGIAKGFSHEHGYASDFASPRKPVEAKEEIEVGRKLTLKEGGFNCVQCHGAGKQKAVSPFEAPGTNLADARERIRYDFYYRWMLHPLRVDPVTKMPKLTPDSRTTGLKDVYDGDARRQFNAIWQYIQSLDHK